MGIIINILDKQNLKIRRKSRRRKRIGEEEEKNRLD